MPIVVAVVTRMRQVPGEFTEQGLCNTFWAAARYHLDREMVMPMVIALVDFSRKTPGEFTVQGLANATWALALLKVDGRLRAEDAVSVRPGAS
eukprot:1321648-Amphidinium_carterae.1